MCISPVMIKNTNNVRKYSHHAVPCGKCHECRLSRGAGWAFRLAQEEKQHSTALFVTFTYDPLHIPYTPTGKATLQKDHLQKFFKILRKVRPSRIKYYACGEYGTNTIRPHYHAIIFGSTQDDITASWRHGHVFFGEVSQASVSYVVGYMNKPHVKIFDDRVPEFSLMSKGLGASYMSDAVVKYHKENLAGYVTLEGGNKAAMPRYYRQKIFDSVEREKLAERAELEHELRNEKYIRDKGYDVYAHETNEAKKAAIKRQSFNLKNKRRTL